MTSHEQAHGETVSGRGDTIHASLRAILVVRCLLAVATAALLISNWISVTSTNFGDSPGSGTPGKIQLARYLNAIALPLVLIAAVLTLSVIAAIYVERLQTDLTTAFITRSEDDASGPLLVHAVTPSEPIIPVRAVQEHDDAIWRRS